MDGYVIPPSDGSTCPTAAYGEDLRAVDDQCVCSVCDVRRSAAEYFRGRRRLFEISFEGVFHQDLNGDDLILSADFDRPLRLVCSQ